MHLINFVHDFLLAVNTLGNNYSLSIGNMEILKLRGAYKGIGVFAFYTSPRGQIKSTANRSSSWNTQLIMTEETSIESLQWQSSDETIQLNLPDPFTCTGLMTWDMEGFIVAPTIKLEMHDGRDIAIMLLSSIKEAVKIDVEKTSLSIASDKINATVFMTIADGVLFDGTISGEGFSMARLFLTRKPQCSTIQRAFTEKIAETKGPGQIHVTWRPVSRSFEDTLVVFRPNEIKDYDLERVADLIGADDDTFLGPEKPPFLIGDGNGTSYTVTLVLDRFLRRDLSDETSISVR